jgi:hypothetical protein
MAIGHGQSAVNRSSFDDETTNSWNESVRMKRYLDARSTNAPAPPRALVAVAPRTHHGHIYSKQLMES